MIEIAGVIPPVVIKWTLIGLGTLATEAAKWYDAAKTTITSIIVMVGLLYGIISVILAVLLKPLLAHFLDTPNFLLNYDLTTRLWHMTLNVANGLFLLALIVASIAIILRIDTGTYQIKKTITTLITAVALSNLSLLIVRAMVDFGDLLADAFATIGGPLKAGEQYSDFLYGLTTTPELSHKIVWWSAILKLLFMAIIFWIVIKLTIFVFERGLMIMFLAVVAPLAFALSLLPNTKEYAKEWWPLTIKWVLAWPIFVGIAKIASLFLNQLAASSEVVSQLQAPFPVDEKIDISISGSFILACIGLYILYYAADIPSKLKLSAPLSGYVGKEGAYKAVMGTIAGKGAVGYLGKAVLQSTPVRVFRESLTGAGGLGSKVAARIFNAKAYAEQQKADKEREVKEGVVKRLMRGSAIKGQEAAPLKQRLEYLETLPGYENNPEYKTKKKQYDALIESQKALRGTAGWQQKPLKVEPEMRKTVEEYQDDIKEAIEKKDGGKMLRTLAVLKDIVRDKYSSPEDAEAATDVLNAPAILKAADDLGIKSTRYKVRIKTRLGIEDFSKDQALMEATDAEDAAKTTAKSALGLPPNSNLLDDVDLTSSPDFNQEEKLQESLGTNSTLAHLTDAEKNIYLQAVINARKTTGTTNSAQIQAHLTGLNAPAGITTDIIKAINNTLSKTSNKSAIENYALISDEAGGDNAGITRIILKLKDLQKASQEREDLEVEINRETQRDQPAYSTTIKDHIRKLAIKDIEQSQGVKINDLNIAQYQPEIKIKSEAIRVNLVTQYQNMGNELDTSLSQYDSGDSNKVVDVNTFNLADHKDAIQSVPPVIKHFTSDKALEEATIGELKAYQRLISNGLDKIQF